jgi:hypothetical protein
MIMQQEENREASKGADLAIICKEMALEMGGHCML